MTRKNLLWSQLLLAVCLAAGGCGQRDTFVAQKNTSMEVLASMERLEDTLELMCREPPTDEALARWNEMGARQQGHFAAIFDSYLADYYQRHPRELLLWICRHMDTGDDQLTPCYLTYAADSLRQRMESDLERYFSDAPVRRRLRRYLWHFGEEEGWQPAD